jgi:hypothetical protein
MRLGRLRGGNRAVPIEVANAAPRCTATSKRTKQRCRAAAMRGRPVCYHHGARGGPVTVEGQKRCAEAATKHGRYKGERERRKLRAETKDMIRSLRRVLRG